MEKRGRRILRSKGIPFAIVACTFTLPEGEQTMSLMATDDQWPPQAKNRPGATRYRSGGNNLL